MRIIAAVILGLTLSSTLGACVVYDRPACRYGWEPEHRDERGRIIPGHCR